MSLEMTFRQKLIRIGSSAAICGLSFSFIVGESVDRQATQLRAWTIDPVLLPDAYLPLRPLASALDQMEAAPWRDNLVAINNLPNLSETPARMEPLREATPVLLARTPTIYMEPKIVSVAAAARKPRALPVVEKVEKEEQVQAAEVEVILGSIHEATSKLSAESSKRLAFTAPPQISQSNSLKITPSSPDKTPVHPPFRVASADSFAERTIKRTDHGIGWSIQGKIWGTTAHNIDAGHFEVGLFTKIDPDGNPVGYPISQQFLPAGQTSFKLDVPVSVERGYLFADFVAAKTGKRTLVAPPTNPWERSNRHTAELFFRSDDAISTVAAAPTLRDLVKDQWKIQGTVTTMFVSGQASIPQGDVIVKVRGRREAARTDAKGNFVLELPRVKGTLFLEVIKNGFHPSIVSISSGDERPLRVEIASRHAIDQISQRLGANQGSSHGIFLGQALSADGTGLRGITAQLSLKADGPFYFDDEGNATRDAKMTGSTGRFLFLNVESGTGYLETSLGGEAIAPIQVSSVDGGEMVHKYLTPVSGSLRGRIFNPVAQGGKMQPITSARVRVDGASEWVTSDSYGAFSIGPLKWMKGERISLEVSAEKFNNHRYLVSADLNGAALNLFAFPASYISHLAHTMDVDMDPYSGIVIGKVSGPSLRIDALADHSTVNNAKDFYFDSHGRLRGSHEMTDPRFGTYIIFNVPKGRALLQGNDNAGVLRYSDAVFANPASINVEME